MRAVPLSAVVAKDLKAWRKAQAAERLAWGPDWPDTGRVFTHEDGQPITGQWLSRRFATLAWRADLPYVRFHDLRHGAASLPVQFGRRPASQGRLRSPRAQHGRVHHGCPPLSVAEELAESAASAIAAYIPRKSRLREAE